MPICSPKLPVPRASNCPASRRGGSSDNPPLSRALPRPVVNHKPADSCFPVSPPLAPPFSTPLGAGSPHCSSSSWSPTFPSLNPNPCYPGPQTDLWNTPSHPSCPQFRHSRSSQFPPPDPPFPERCPKGTWHALHSPASCLSSHRSLHRAPPSRHVCQLKPFPS